ncbi:MAG TPA: tRNA-intron lyase [Candidatus Thermoplasmatota archaeon]|nr:tRNA-intron lyase [Candidatus Thermoplasmatota archaeon]
MPPKARLKGERVVVPDEKEASTLYNKGAFGVPQSGGALELDLVEALYLVENNRLAVEGMRGGDLLRHASALEGEFDIRYVVYRDLRARGFVVKPSNVTDYNVYPRGALPGRAPSTSLVRCASERGRLDAAAVVADVERAGRHGKTLLLALVDEEGDLTYYEASVQELKADVAPLPRRRTRAHLLADRVVVTDKEDAKRLFEDGYFGRDVGLALQLSLPEALYLAESGRLDVDGVDVDELRRRAREAEPDFDLRHDLYATLRRAGLVVKTGFKYGTHFRVYAGPPEEEHAPYLAHAIARSRLVPWPEVAGFVRLAHGVRKRLFFAVERDGGFALLELARRRP